jgi:hypothetical protein
MGLYEVGKEYAELAIRLRQLELQMEEVVALLTPKEEKKK